MDVRCTIGLIGVVCLSACGSDTVSMPDPNEGREDAGQNSGGAQGEPSYSLAIACDDAEESLYADPGELPAEKGAIIRCVDDGVIKKEDIDKALSSLENDTTNRGENGVINRYQGAKAEHGIHVYRVLYRTERGNGAPGYAVSTMYVPDREPTERMPLLLAARGSRGQGPRCAPSVTDESAPLESVDATTGRWVHDELMGLVLPFASSGFVVAVTDSAGYANYGAEGNPPSGFADVEDMAKSFLDSGHALRKLMPEATSADVMLVGLSQGGHTVLGSLQVANDYPAPGKIIAAAVYAPLWFAQRAWGSVLNPIASSVGVVLNESSGVPVSIWYHYTQAELYDGPGEGVKLFKPELRDTIKDFVDNTCWSATYRKLEEATRPKAPASDFFSDEMVAAIGDAALSRSCDKSPDKALCEKWMARYRNDHPVLTGEAAKVPLLVAYGLKDPTIPPARFKCAVDKLNQGGSPIEFCIDPEANHGGVALTQSEYVKAWLRHKATGEAITLSCPENEVPEGLFCDPFLPND